MPLVLDDAENDVVAPRTTRSAFTRLINSIRIYHIPFVNFIIVYILGSFLLKLTTKYTDLYMKSSLITIIVTNLVLYGISETLAQCILSYKSYVPFLTFRIDRGDAQFMSFNSHDIVGTQQQTIQPYDEDEEPDLNDTEGVERFVDFVQRDNESIASDDGITMRPYNPSTGLVDEDVTPVPELTYFQFNRLAGFMCWGFIMSFFQCWWYKFLQIYAKDPKFIEVLRKVMTDQFVYSPISLFCFFTYGTIVLENGTWEDTKDKLHRIYLKTLMISYSVWFPVQFINFLLVPRSLQVPFSSSISVLWNCFLSMKNSSN